MKRFLCAGEGYAPFPTNINFRTPRYFPAWRAPFIYIFCFFMCLQAIHAQDIPNDQNPRKLSTADRVPTEFWTKSILYYEDGMVQQRTLEEFRGKAILLDFWSVYCGACIQSFPTLKAMQEKYPEELIVLLVNRMEKEGKEELDKLFARFDDSYKLPSIMKDTFLHLLFPHGPIPHYVWIGIDGKVDAFTRRIYFTEENVRIFLRKNEQN